LVSNSVVSILLVLGLAAFVSACTVDLPPVAKTPVEDTALYPTSQFPRKDLLPGLQAHLEELTGPAPVHCGLHRMPRAGDQWAAARDVALRRMLACGTDAARQHRAFWTLVQQPADGSWVADGLLGSNASGRGGEPTFTTRRCDLPTINRTPNPGTLFTCTL
jgi:hypothetical protein